MMPQHVSPGDDPTVTVVQDAALARKEPLVSVCILTYNQEHYIREAVDSVLAQETDFAYEIIIGDDCSTDGTREILEDYQREHPERIRLHLHEQHYEGVPGRKNMVTNLRGARGKYVAILDGDDYWISTDKLQRQTGFLEEHPDVTLSFHDARTVFDDEVAQERYGEQEAYLMSERYSACMSESTHFTRLEIIHWQRGNHGFFVAAGSMMFRRTLFAPVPDWFWRVWNADNAMQMHFARHGSVYYHHDLLSCRRKSAASMTVNFHGTLRQNRGQIDQTFVFDEIAPSYGGPKSAKLSFLYRRRMRLLFRKNQPLRATYSLLKATAYYARYRARWGLHSLRNLL